MGSLWAISLDVSVYINEQELESTFRASLFNELARI